MSKEVLNEDLMEVLKQFQKFKKSYEDYKHENNNLKAKVNRLEAEVQASLESEKSHRYNLSAARKMITDLQNNISNLVAIKVEMKKMTLDLEQKNCLIENMDKAKTDLIDKHKREMVDLKKKHEEQINLLKLDCEKKVSNMQNETDTDIAQSACLIQELNKKVTEVQKETNDKINIIVLDYEEQLQKLQANLTHLQNEHNALIVRSNTNIEVYQKRINELEEKLRASQIDQNSFKTETYSNNFTKPKTVSEDAASFYKNTPNRAINGFKPASKLRYSSLQIINKNDNVQNRPAKNVENKNTFSVVKKRKLYSNKDNLD